MMRRWWLLSLAVLLCGTSTSLAALEAEARFKWFSTGGLLPSHDLQRQRKGTPAYDHSADLRIMVRHNAGELSFSLDQATTWLYGDGLAFNNGPDTAVDQTVREDSRRRWDWTWVLEQGPRKRTLSRIDRFAMQWTPGDWSITLGRQAVSWGSGMVFQPMDLFSPFSPTVVDRDYKAGDDVVLVDRLLNNGHDLQLLHVVRRDADGEVSGDVSSSALKWHGYFSSVEFEAVAARHYDEPVYAATLRMPLGTALLRTDVVATRDLAGDWIYSGIVNADVSFVVDGRNAYAFLEFFHNGWGVDELPQSALTLPRDLTERVARGELFNLMKDYSAVGFTYEWHPLITQATTLITNLHDSSSLVQAGITYVPGDHQSVQFGWIEPLGRAGDEFGGVPLFGDRTTSGGGSRFYLRWVYYL